MILQVVMVMERILGSLTAPAKGNTYIHVLYYRNW
jgi:hypothetical protein